MANAIPNFLIGLQVADDSGSSAEGEPRYTNKANAPHIWSEWAMDMDQYDPDAVKVGLEVDEPNSLPDRDIRIELQAADGGGSSALGPKQTTPWASEGGGWSGLATDADAYDPDAFRVKIQTRPWMSSRTIDDLRLGLQLFDSNGRELGNSIVFTPWASEGGGWSDYVVDRDEYDPDGLKIKLEVEFE